MSFDEWLMLSNTERQVEQRKWQTYSKGYWHDLREEAARRFEAEFGHMPQIRRTDSGVFHGGGLIISVSTTLPEAESLPLPENYLGFRVIQMTTGDPEFNIHLSASQALVLYDLVTHLQKEEQLLLEHPAVKEVLSFVRSLLDESLCSQHLPESEYKARLAQAIELVLASSSLQ